MNESDDFLNLFENVIYRIRSDIGDKNDFLEEINNTSNLAEKFKLLLQFLANDFPGTKLFYTSHEIEMFLHQIFLIENECPTDFNLFMKWLPKFIIRKNKTVISVQKRVSKLQLHIQELIGYISTLNDSFDFNEFTNKESIFSPGINSGNEEEKNFIKENQENYIEYLRIINNLKIYITKLKNELSKIEKRQKNEQSQFIQLNEQLKYEKKQNEQFQKQIENYKSKSINLINQIEKLKQKQEELQIENLKIKNFINQNENSYKSNISLLKKKISVLQNKTPKSGNESDQTENSDENFELTHLKNLLKNSQKEIECLTEKTEIYQKLINDLSNPGNPGNQSNMLKDKLFQLNEENKKIKIENEEILKNHKLLTQKIQNLASSLNKSQIENEKLKNELQSAQDLSSSTLNEQIEKLKIENEELKKSFSNISSSDDKILKTVSTSTSTSLLQIDSQTSSISSIVSNEDNRFKHSSNDKEKEISCLKRKIHLLEAEKIKLIGSLKKFQTQNNQDSNQNAIDIKRIGFLLADALCQRYNPSRAGFEIKRLIEVARSEHIRLNESARVPLDPFKRFNEDCKVISAENLEVIFDQKNNLFSGFDELDCQLSSMKSYICNKKYT